MVGIWRRTSVLIATSLALLGGSVVIARPVVAAACSVRNDRPGTTYDTLQAAVDASAEGDTLLLEGTCVGTTVIHRTTLHLEGVPSSGQPISILEGAGSGRVLRLRSANVVITDLAITNGRSLRGAGIKFLDGRLVLDGVTSIFGNAATLGGGGVYQAWHDFRRGSYLTLTDSASVSRNTSEGDAGGILGSSWAPITMNGAASVTGNTTTESGGGIEGYNIVLNDATSVSGNTAGADAGGIDAMNTLSLNDSASVNGNTAVGNGGGLITWSGLIMTGSSSIAWNRAGGSGGGVSTDDSVTMNDSSSVTGNTAGVAGGGIYPDAYGIPIRVCSDHVTISPNDPDDPPAVSHICP